MRALLAATLLLAGCSTGASLEQLRTRAAFDFDCPRDKLTVAHVDRDVEGVPGGGRRRTYIQDCEHEDGFGVRRGCTWIVNASSP